MGLELYFKWNFHDKGHSSTDWKLIVILRSTIEFIQEQCEVVFATGCTYLGFLAHQVAQLGLTKILTESADT